MRVVTLLLAVFIAQAQTPQPAPSFTQDTIRIYGRINSKLLAPGMILELWGKNLAPINWCGEEQAHKAPLPHEICGVRVLIGSHPAELMYVSGGQINLRISEGVPNEGMVPIQVCVGKICSSPVEMQFSTRIAVLSLEQPAYIRMPVWIHVDAPAPYFVSYPCGFQPWSFHGYEFEVLYKGQPFASLPQKPRHPNAIADAECTGPTVRSSLPLHLLYRFEEPGQYSIRFTARKNGQILYRSDWTDIQIQPFSEQKRREWLKATENELNSRGVGQIVAALLAWPDEEALALLLKLAPANTTMCVNYDCVRLAFVRAGLAGFDQDLLRRTIPENRLRELCPPDGACQ